MAFIILFYLKRMEWAWHLRCPRFSQGWNQHCFCSAHFSLKDEFHMAFLVLFSLEHGICIAFAVLFCFLAYGYLTFLTSKHWFNLICLELCFIRHLTQCYADKFSQLSWDVWRPAGVPTIQMQPHFMQQLINYFVCHPGVWMCRTCHVGQVIEEQQCGHWVN